jgi:polyisoprenoid-binding protein YceI
MTLPTRLLLFIAPLLFASNALAQHEVFNINPEASQVNFILGANDHGTHGTFRVQHGAITFDRKVPMIAGIVVVSANSGNTGNDSRDKKMTNEVLEAAHFADVSFVPKSYEGAIAPTGDSTIQVSGVFTLHGTPHDITVPMHLHIDGAGCTAKTTFTVPYVKWGLKDPSIFILKVAKEVQIELTLNGMLSTATLGEEPR